MPNQTKYAKIIQEANVALIADRNLNAVEKYFAPDYVVHTTNLKFSGGYSTVESILNLMLKAFSNIDVKVEILLEGVDRIAWQRTMTATQSGPYKGFPATGREIVWRDMVVSQFEGVLIKEEWLSTDLAERLLLSRKQRK